EGRRLGGLGCRNVPMKPFNHPTDVAFAPSGEIYVSDGYGNHQVHRFSADGQLLGSWGKLGRERGSFIDPHSIWVRRDGSVLVADRGNNRVQVFTAEGDWVEEWTGLFRPLGIWGDADDNVFVTDL